MTSVGTFTATRCDVPALQRSDHVELAWTVHRLVDGRVFGQLGERSLQPIGKRDAAKVALVERHHGLLVLLAIGCACLLVASERFLRFERQQAA